MSLFQSRYRKEFGKDVGRLFERFEQDVSEARDARRWIDCAFEWLRKVDAPDRADALRLIWFERIEVDRRLALSSLISGAEAGRNSLVMLRSNAGSPLYSGGQRKEWERKARELQQTLDARDHKIVELGEALRDDMAFAAERGPGIFERYGRPDSAQLPTLEELNQKSPDAVRTAYYSRLFGPAIGCEVARIEDSNRAQPAGLEYVAELVGWLSNVAEEDRAAALTFATLIPAHKEVARYANSLRERSAYLQEQLSIAKKSGRRDLAADLEREFTVNQDLMRDPNALEGDLKQKVEALHWVEERYGTPPFRRRTQEATTVNPMPWLLWKSSDP